MGLKEALLGRSKGQQEGLRAWGGLGGGLGGRGETTAEQKVPQAQEAMVAWGSSPRSPLKWTAGPRETNASGPQEARPRALDAPREQ